MRFPILIFVLSLAGVALCVGLWGPLLNGPLLAAALGVVVSLLLILRKILAPRRYWVIVDGSNVLYWEGDSPKLSSLLAVLADLRDRRFDPIVWFDANAGYLVKGRYMGPMAFSRELDLPRSRIFVSPKGQPADPLILDHAAALGAQVVTNDRFRDWAAAHPRVSEPGYLLRGQVTAGRAELWVDA
jgi:hypothetical protein